MAADREDSGIMELVAIAVLLFMFWRFYIKDKDKVIEPATTPGELKDEFARDPNFNLNDYCKDIVGNPLSTTDLTLSNLYGRGWCRRGDGSAIDEKQGFGDAYAEKQAEEYQEMKEDEALFINNKSVIQFRLINSTGSPLSTDILNTTSNPVPFNNVFVGPVAGAATNISIAGFTANWSAISDATGYYLDIATDVSFLSLVPGYNALDVGNVTSEDILGLESGLTYYYRVRAYKASGESENSNIVSVTVLTTIYILELASTGDGTGVAALTMQSSSDALFSLDGDAKFYSDAAGTIDESSTWILTAGSDETIYIKCGSGTSNLRISANVITRWVNWTSGANSPSMAGDISAFTSSTFISILGSNAISGDIALLANLTRLEIGGELNTLTGSVTLLTSLNFINVGGNNTISGDISNLTLLTSLIVGGVNTLTGSLTNLSVLTYLNVGGNNTISGDVTLLTSLEWLNISGNNTISGDVSSLINLTDFIVSGSNTLTGSISLLVSVQQIAVTGSNTLSGDIGVLVSVYYVSVDGNNTLSGDIASLTSLLYFSVTGNNSITFSNVTNLLYLSYLYVHSSVTLSAANVNQLLADFWLNRDEYKPYVFRLIDLQGSPATDAPTGQGIIDKAALQAYRSPGDNPAYPLWDVRTR